MSNPTSRDQQRLEHVEACLEEEHDRRDGEDFASDRGKTIKEAILAKVTRERNVSFAEIEDIEGCRGEYEMRFPDINVVLWSGLSAEAIDAIEALQKEGSHSCDPVLAAGLSTRRESARSTDTERKAAPRWVQEAALGAVNFFARPRATQRRP